MVFFFYHFVVLYKVFPSFHRQFVAHPNIQQLLAALWYAGIPGFRRKAVTDKCLEIVKVRLNALGLTMTMIIMILLMLS